MKFRNFWEKVPLKNYIYLSLGITILTALSVLVLKNSLPPVVPLFYGKPVGEEQLVPALALETAAGISLLVILLNTALSSLVEEAFLKKALVISSFFISLLTAITVFKIIFLVGFF